MAAKKKIPLLKSAYFWNKLADLFGLLGTGGLVSLDVNHADHKWTWIVGAATAIVQVIRLLFADNNHNNVPDILEEQEEEVTEQNVNISVKPNPIPGEPPIVNVDQTTTTTEKKDPENP